MGMRNARRLGFAFAALAVSCLGAPARSAPAPVRRVLFVGNSLTYVNDLPALVVTISRRGGRHPALAAEVVAFPDAALEDHWNHRAGTRGSILARIESGGFQDVVLQQGPSSLPESRVHLIAWTKRFAEPIRAAGARPALYMVWPAASRRGDFPGVVASYGAAAESVGGLLLPAGAAWQAAWRVEPTLELYGADGFHPSPVGSYLAALVVEAALTERPPFAQPIRLDVGGGGRRSRLDVDARLAEILARAATEALTTRR